MSYPRNTWWPEVFITGEIPADANHAALCADAITAWANCMIGKTPPEGFGMVLVQIGKFIGCSDMTVEGVSAFAKEKGWL